MSRRRDRTQLIVLAVAAIAVWAVAAYFRMRPPEGPAPNAGTPAVALSTAAVPAVASAVASAPPAASASAGSAALAPSGSAPAPGATVAPRAPADVTACVAGLFPADAFKQGTADFAFVCTDPYPRHAITEIQAQVVLGRGSAQQMTDGMREWAGLGWYQLAALAVLRGRCCSGPPELNWTFKLACPLDEALRELERAVAKDDGAAVEAAIKRYTDDARCITKLGQASNFGQSAQPGAGLLSLRQILARMGHRVAD